MPLFAACSDPATPEFTPTPTRTPRPTSTSTPTSTPTPMPTPTPAWPVTVFVPPGLPRTLSEALDGVLAEHPEFFVPITAAESADVQIVLNPSAEANPLAEWVYALVVPFPTLNDGVTWAEVAGRWNGSPSGPFAEQPLLMTADTAQTLTTVMGEPSPEAIEIVPEEEIAQRAWDTRPAWAIVPFDQLEPRWKVLRVDNVLVLDRELDTTAYPLIVRVCATGLERGVDKLHDILPNAGETRHSITNRDPDKLSVVMMTGVTALTRATAMRMARHGVTYPAQDIRDWLLEPDITHISSEVSFAEDCPPPGDYYTMVFCSDPSFIELLEDVDIDVVELTGNHLLDWGLEAMELSLKMYEEHQIPYFGGGWDIIQARKPFTVTHGVHKFAFVGCNPAGPPSVFATENRAGAAPCAYGQIREQLAPQVRQLREQGFIPIVTLQYLEFDRYAPTPQQQADFRALAEAGAAIVSGSQAHQPQGFDFHAGAYIHYGLGNLFFDQMQRLEYRQEFLDRHIFYDGHHISTEVLTAILEDYSRPRPMTAEERAELLEAAFAASGW